LDTLPFVSVIIPCYNEEKYVARCLESILAGVYPQNRMEILVVDGRSNDKTRDIIMEYSLRYPIIKLFDNPERLKPHALNTGIRAAVGEIIIRMDAHATYEKEYVSNSVRYLNEYSVENVGGIRKTLPSGDGIMAKSIAYSISSSFAAGNAIYRIGAKEFKWVDTVFGGCYRRSLFEKIGYFNETLVRGQDREFNIRLQKAGGRILYAPDIVCNYYARSDLRRYIPWIFSAGLTPFFTSRLIGKLLFSWRNLAPPAFVVSLIALFFLSFIHSFFAWLFVFEVFIYIVSSITAAIPFVRQENDIRYFISMPLIFFLTHLFYGIGALTGFVKSKKDAGEWTKV